MEDMTTAFKTLSKAQVRLKALIDTGACACMVKDAGSLIGGKIVGDDTPFPGNRFLAADDSALPITGWGHTTWAGTARVYVVPNLALTGILSIPALCAEDKSLSVIFHHSGAFEAHGLNLSNMKRIGRCSSTMFWTDEGDGTNEIRVQRNAPLGPYCAPIITKQSELDRRYQQDRWWAIRQQDSTGAARWTSLSERCVALRRGDSQYERQREFHEREALTNTVYAVVPPSTGDSVKIWIPNLQSGDEPQIPTNKRGGSLSKWLHGIVEGTADEFGRYKLCTNAGTFLAEGKFFQKVAKRPQAADKVDKLVNKLIKGSTQGKLHEGVADGATVDQNGAASPLKRPNEIDESKVLVGPTPPPYHELLTCKHRPISGIRLLHYRYLHLNIRKLHTMWVAGAFRTTGIKISNEEWHQALRTQPMGFVCDWCTLMNISKSSHMIRRHPVQSVYPFAIVNVDFVGPIIPRSSKGHRFFFVTVCRLTGCQMSIPTKTRSYDELFNSVIPQLVLQAREHRRRYDEAKYRSRMSEAPGTERYRVSKYNGELTPITLRADAELSIGKFDGKTIHGILVTVQSNVAGRAGHDLNGYAENRARAVKQCLRVTMFNGNVDRKYWHLALGYVDYHSNALTNRRKYQAKCPHEGCEAEFEHWDAMKQHFAETSPSHQGKTPLRKIHRQWRKKLMDTPFKQLHYPHDFKYMYVFGSPAVSIRHNIVDGRKFDANGTGICDAGTARKGWVRTTDVIHRFVGYDKGVGYILLDTDTGRTFKTVHVRILEGFTMLPARLNLEDHCDDVSEALKQLDDYGGTGIIGRGDREVRLNHVPLGGDDIHVSGRRGEGWTTETEQSERQRRYKNSRSQKIIDRCKRAARRGERVWKKFSAGWHGGTIMKCYEPGKDYLDRLVRTATGEWKPSPLLSKDLKSGPLVLVRYDDGDCEDLSFTQWETLNRKEAEVRNETYRPLIPVSEPTEGCGDEGTSSGAATRSRIKRRMDTGGTTLRVANRVETVMVHEREGVPKGLVEVLARARRHNQQEKEAAAVMSMMSKEVNDRDLTEIASLMTGDGSPFAASGEKKYSAHKKYSDLRIINDMKPKQPPLEAPRDTQTEAFFGMTPQRRADEELIELCKIANISMQDCIDYGAHDDTPHDYINLVISAKGNEGIPEHETESAHRKWIKSNACEVTYCVASVAVANPDYTKIRASSVEVPTNAIKAMDKSNVHYKKWKLAINSEIDSMLENEVMEMVPITSMDKVEGSKLIGYRMVLKVKATSSGGIDKFKARLCCRGDLTVFQKDYFETFSPVIRSSTVRIILNLAAYYDLELNQADVKTAFLNAKLPEDEQVLYMKIPDYYPGKQAGMVFKLKRSIYGLAQAPRMWHCKLKEILLKFGYKCCLKDVALFYKDEDDGSRTFLGTFVDDLICASKQAKYFDALMTELRRHDLILDVMGEPEYLLSMRITRYRKWSEECEWDKRKQYTIELRQDAMIEEIASLLPEVMSDGGDLSRVKMVASPMADARTQRLTDDDMTPLSDKTKRARKLKKRGRMLIGKLLYVAAHTRPDIAYVVGKLCRHMHRPGAKTIEVAERCIRWIYHSRTLPLVMGGVNEDELITRERLVKCPPVGYSDASWNDETKTSQSTLGYLLTHGMGPIVWKSKVGPEIRPCMSSSESELYAAVLLSLDLVWTRQFLQELGAFDGSTPSPVFIDNVGAEVIMQQPGEHNRFRHIRRRWYYIRVLCGDGSILPVHVHTDFQAGDGMTKPLQGKILRRHMRTAHNVTDDQLDEALPKLRKTKGTLEECLVDSSAYVTMVTTSDANGDDMSGLVGRDDVWDQDIYGECQKSFRTCAMDYAREVLHFYETEKERDGWVFAPQYLGIMDGIGMSDQHLSCMEIGTGFCEDIYV